MYYILLLKISGLFTLKSSNPAQNENIIIVEFFSNIKFQCSYLCWQAQQAVHNVGSAWFVTNTIGGGWVII